MSEELIKKKKDKKLIKEMKKWRKRLIKAGAIQIEEGRWICKNLKQFTKFQQ